MSELEQWLDGVELYFAYREFSHPFQLAKYKAATGPGPIYALRSLMYGELFGKLASAELEAFGFRTAPTPSDGPVRIPVHCFMSPPNLDECNDDKITSSGWHYERVKISPPLETKQSDIPKKFPPDGKRGGGRPSLYPATRETLLEIYGIDPNLIKQSAEQLEIKFNKLFPRHAQDHGRQERRVESRTLRNHLKRFRQELAETSENISSN